MAFVPRECLSSVPFPPKPSLAASLCGFGILLSPRPAVNTAQKIILRPVASLNVALIASSPATAPNSVICPRFAVYAFPMVMRPQAVLSFISSNVSAAKPSDTPAEKGKSYSGAAHTGKLVDAARKAKEVISRAKREDERVRREERARREKERERKEKEEKDRKEKDRKEKERRERKKKEREEKDRENRREREKRKHDKHYESRHRGDDDYRRGERSDRERDYDRFRPSRDRSPHRDYDHSGSESGSESEGWTKVSHHKHKSKSY